MRTLVLGIPLPNTSFDNYSFLSAPSFIEYQRMIVELSAIGKQVQSVVDGTGVHTTFGGQAIVNGPASPHAFGLRQLLDMRRREAARFFAAGGLLVAFAHPPASVRGLAADDGQEEGEWATYSWLPEPEGFSYSAGVLPGFGREGAIVTEADHPFAPFVRDLGPRIAYRAYLNEETSEVPEGLRIFARSPSGVAIGWDFPAGGGKVVLLPAVSKPDTERQAIAATLASCLDDWARPGAALASDGG